MSGSGDGPQRGDPAEEGAVRDAFGGLMRAVLGRGKKEVERAAAEGRNRLELRTLRRDRELMYQKLGKEVRRLAEAGELSHPGVARGVSRIAELDARIGALEQGLPGPEPEEGAAPEADPSAG
ncbi:MAG: hypothetical protein RL071_2555 [Pseudomonadota bacterium]|jgi:hypothetical protein